MRLRVSTAIPGVTILLSLVLCFYWLPLLAWLVGQLRFGFSLPASLPFGTLARLTITVSLIAATVSTLAAYPYVLLWRISGAWIRRMITLAMVIPMLMGLLARNYSWIGILSSNQPLASMGWTLLGGATLIYTQASTYLVMACIFVPIAFFVLIQGTTTVLPEHIEAARTLGLDDQRILFAVVLPSTFRSAVMAFGLTLAMAVGYFVTPRMIGGGKVDFISNAILAYVNFGRFDIASAIALLFFLIMLIPSSLLTYVAIKRRLLTSGR